MRYLLLVTRHPPVLLHGLLHRRPVRDEADGTRPTARGCGRAMPAGRASAGEPGLYVQLGKNVWAKEFRERRADVPIETIEKYLHNLYRLRPDFVYSVSRDFARTCQTPMLVLPDDLAAHPLQTSIDIA
jgi:hypothetical protein